MGALEILNPNFEAIAQSIQPEDEDDPPPETQKARGVGYINEWR